MRPCGRCAGAKPRTRSARYGALLTPEEEARRRRYLFEPSRCQHLLARVLVRSARSRCAEVGVDVEYTPRKSAYAQVARRFFA